MHAGPQHLLASIRESYWPISGRNLAKQVSRSCVQCFKVAPKTITPLMGNLPSSRVTIQLPFQVCGVDYAGPFLLKNYVYYQQISEIVFNLPSL
ncbi:hypothetical protein QE152_g38639 [Popillia japonica]|uniref:Integrase zinc-binding domain-containing protein n=1 Tax=Popillia japonica TaxID=7064 RepID=A0AAW1HW16_POPJA